MFLVFFFFFFIIAVKSFVLLSQFYFMGQLQLL